MNFSQSSTGACTCYYNLTIQDPVHLLQKSYSGDIDELHYVSTVPFNFVPMSAVSNTVFVMSEISSILENDLKKKLHITQQQEKELY